MNAVVIYRSKTGFTQRYARWLAQELGCEAVPYDRREKADLAGADTVIYADFLHVGKLKGLPWLAGKLPTLQGKRVAVLAVGACPPEDPGLPAAMDAIFPGGTWAGVARFYCQGGLNYERMGAFDRLLMKVKCAVEKREAGADGEAYQAITRSFDAAHPSALAPLIAWAKNE